MDKKKTIIIAEIGENHIGDMDIAKSLISKAKDAGADYVKFQSYRLENFNPKDEEYEWFKKVSLSDEAHYMLKEHASGCGIKFLSAPFSPERARFLCEELGLKDIKIASGMMMRDDLLDYVNKHAQRVFLSTGMADVDEIRRSVSRLGDVQDLYILHCVTQYPCQDEDANLLAIEVLKKEIPGYHIGYSDHTIGKLAALGAVAMGAQAIEKHFTFDRKAKEGTDHELSLDFEGLSEAVKEIRRLEVLMGDGAKVPAAGEKAIRDFVRNRFIP
jgi:sialic acid synthase SpsE